MTRPISPRPFPFARSALLAVAVLLAAPLGHAAKGDKPDKVDKLDKIEKYLKERGANGSGSSRSSSPAPSPGSSGSRSQGSSSGSSRSSKSLPPANPTTAPAAEFEPFKTIVDRNIFNPNRTGRSRGSEDGPAVKVDQIALVGTMESEEGRVAFFDSADAAHRKALRVGGEIAGFTVKEILPGGVELTQGDKTTALRVNQQLRRVAGGDWRVSGRDPLRADVARTGDSTTSTSSAVPANASDVLRRLMEQRQKQLKQ